MIGKIYKLKFLTPVHLGAAELGGKLESVSFSYGSDKLFGALCCELSENENLLLNFVEKIRREEIFFSDLLPYKGDNFYLPKPILLVDSQKTPERLELVEMRLQATQRKKQKKIEFIRASRFEEYFSAVKRNSPFQEENNFGETELVQKVSCRAEEPLPYYVGTFSFNSDSGFYLIAFFEDDRDKQIFRTILEYLGLSGIGGKRSSGFGKFFLIEEISLEGCMNEDLAALNKMLTNKSASWQMNLSSLLPSPDEISTLKKSYFKLKRRGGFVSAISGEIEQKKNNICVVVAGSCFPHRLKGELLSVDKINGHEVYRLGKSIYAGLSI